MRLGFLLQESPTKEEFRRLNVEESFKVHTLDRKYRFRRKMELYMELWKDIVICIKKKI